MKTKFKLLFLLIGTLNIACNSKKEGAQIDENVVPVITVSKQDTIVQNSFVADIQAKKNIEIRTRASGLVQQIFVNEGQFVKKGQRLFKINDAELRMELNKVAANLKQAAAEIKIAEIEVNQLQALYAKDFVALNELDMAKAKLAAARAKYAFVNAELSAVKQKIEFTNIVAPFEGVLDVIPFKEGSLVEEGTLLTSISNNKEVYAYFHVSEKDYLDYTISKGEGKSKEVTLVLANGSTYNYKGLVETTESEFDKSTGNIAFRAKFPNPDNLLKHGASGKVVVKTDLKNAMLIPQKSTFEIQGNVYVFVVNNEGIVQQRQINLISRLSHWYIIEPVLTQERIIYEGIQKVKDGDQVQTELVSFSDNSNSKKDKK
jgi:membrane fusion protein (multidrug efflux system)